MPKRAVSIQLTPAEREKLLRLVRAHRTSQRAVARARIILLAAEGMPTKHIAAEVGVRRRIAEKWRERFAQAEISSDDPLARLQSLEDAPRSGRPRRFSPSQPS